MSCCQWHTGSIILSFVLDWVHSVAVNQLSAWSLDGRNLSWVFPLLTEAARFTHTQGWLTKIEIKWKTMLLRLYLHTEKTKVNVNALTKSALRQHTCVTSLSLRSAVYCHFCCLCPLDAGWRYMSLEFSMWSVEWCQKKWRVIFPKAPHRVQSHYRPCQIQLVTEFAAQERGKERQEGWGLRCGYEMDKLMGK